MSTIENEPATSLPEVSSDSLVVGHDGSPGADEALAVALGLADQLSAPVVVVRAWSIVTAPRPASWVFGYVPPFDEFAEAVRLDLVAGVQALVDAFPDVPVQCHVVHAAPAKSLIDTSRAARMLVVGARGLGGIAELLLGSVSDQCVRHAGCPVLVTRARS